jgi:glycerol-3-phosphate acyltransferase PlsX
LSEPLVISIDAMGGDHGPSVCVRGAYFASQQLPDVRFLLHGDEAQIQAELARLPALRDRTTVIHAERAIAMDEKPAQAMRRGKGTSLWAAVESLKTADAKAAVSAGNTGALMAISKLQLRMVEGLERPAIVANWPTLRGVSVVLDVGANVESDAGQLVEFAIMGAAFHRAVHGSTKPTVGLLNVGSEEQKGHDDVREANVLLRDTPFDFDYRGFIEGNDIAKGTVDVVVTDGFTGNIVLKAAEGLARFFVTELKTTLTSSLMAKLGALVAIGPLKAMRRRLDPGRVNGGPLLGLNGIVVKSHGGADARGFAAAIKVAVDLARSDFSQEIARNLQRLVPAAPKDAGPNSPIEGPQTGVAE